MVSKFKDALAPFKQRLIELQMEQSQIEAVMAHIQAIGNGSTPVRVPGRGTRKRPGRTRTKPGVLRAFLQEHADLQTVHRAAEVVRLVKLAATLGIKTSRGSVRQVMNSLETPGNALLDPIPYAVSVLEKGPLGFKEWAEIVGKRYPTLVRSGTKWFTPRAVGALRRGVVIKRGNLYYAAQA